MKRLCSICARGGSKGVVGKNIKIINGLPLIAFSILQAKKSGLFTHIAVSSDSEEILSTARRYHPVIEIKRPDELASDSSAKLPVIQHCANQVELITKESYDTIVDLDATSPLRFVSDIQNAVIALEDHHQADNLITASPARRSPYFNLVELGNNGYVHLAKTLTPPPTRRQDAPLCFDMNASIYVWRRNKLTSNNSVLMPNTILYSMPEERSVDIDSELDFKIVMLLLKERMHEFE